MAEKETKKGSTPGELLRGARQLYGWSVEDVANELNLLPYIVEALENDDYDQLAGWTYVVGYLRSYGKLVNVNVEGAIKQHEIFLPPIQDGPGTVTENIAHRQPIAIHYRWVVTIVVLIVVVGGLYGAYLQRSNDIERIDLASNELNDELGKIRKEPVLIDTQSKNVESALTIDSTGLMEGATTVIENKDSSQEMQILASAVNNEEASDDAESIPESKAEESKETENDDSVVMKKVQTRSQAPTSKQVAARPATIGLSQSPVFVKQRVSKTEIPQTKTTQKRIANNPIADTLVQTGFLAKVKLPQTGAPSTRSGVSRVLAKTVDETKIKDSKAGVVRESDSTGVVTQSTSTITIALKRGSQLIVHDGSGIQLLRRYLSSGKVVTISGKPPFDIRMRVSDGARVFYNGKAVKVPISGNGMQIRFQVGVTQIGGWQAVITNQGRGE